MPASLNCFGLYLEVAVGSSGFSRTKTKISNIRRALAKGSIFFYTLKAFLVLLCPLAKPSGNLKRLPFSDSLFA